MRTICVYPYRSRCGWFVDFVYLITHRETGGVNHLSESVLREGTICQPNTGSTHLLGPSDDVLRCEFRRVKRRRRVIRRAWFRGP